MRSVTPALVACFSVGLLLGAVLNRISAVREAGRNTKTTQGIGVAGAGRPLAIGKALSDTDQGEVVGTPTAVPGPQPPYRKEIYSLGADGGEYWIIEDSSGISSLPVYHFGLCESPQKNVLSKEGYDDINYEDGPANPKPKLSPCAIAGLNGTVLVVTPMHNRAHMSKGEMAVDRYFRLLQALTYPKQLMSVALLVGDSTDNTKELAKDRLEKLRGKGYRRLMLINKDFGYNADGKIPHEDRHKRKYQLPRRAHLARLRNHLVVTALRDEEYALWLDADLWSYPKDLIQILAGAGKDFVVPHCVVESNAGGEPVTFDLNSWRETEESEALQASMALDEPLFEGYAGRCSIHHLAPRQPLVTRWLPAQRQVPHCRPTHREHMGELVREAQQSKAAGGGGLVELDGVGGAVILIRAALHHDGVLFPPFVFAHAVETEGLAKVAQAAGYSVWGMPLLHVEHK